MSVWTSGRRVSTSEVLNQIMYQVEIYMENSCRKRESAKVMDHRMGIR